jgi:hypothetical protein
MKAVMALLVNPADRNLAQIQSRELLPRSPGRYQQRTVGMGRFAMAMRPIQVSTDVYAASHATLDPDRACSAAQDGTLSLSKAAIRLTQMMKAGDTFLYVRCVMFSSSVPGTITTA